MNIMSLSDWDLLAFDTHGKPCDGNLELENKRKVEIYKNRLYIFNYKSGNQKRPDVSEVNSGESSILGFNIKAIHYDKQNAIFCFVEHTDYSKKDFKTNYLCGIGCNGYESRLYWLKKNHYGVYRKIPKKFLDQNKYWASEYNEFGGGLPNKWGIYFRSQANKARDSLLLDLSKIKEPKISKLWVGVKSETVKAFAKWLKEVAPKEYFEKIDLSKATRQNQGDAFFNKAIGTKIIASKPGKAKIPLIMKMLERS